MGCTQREVLAAGGLPMVRLVQMMRSNPKLEEIYNEFVKPFVPQVLGKYSISFTVNTLGILASALQYIRW